MSIEGHWAQPMYQAVDRMDAAQAMEAYADDVRFQFGSIPPTVGKDAAARGFGFILGTVRGISHDFTAVWDPDERTSVLEADVSYTRWDHEVVTLPCVTVLRHDGPTVDDLRIYIDIEPLVRGQVAEIKLTGAVPVNPTGAEPRLTRGDLWQALIAKARDATRFVPQITSCEIVEEGDGWLVRDVIIEGEPSRERVTFTPEERIDFERVQSRAMGRVINEIEEDDEGELSLRFTFDLQLQGIPEGSPLAKGIAQHMATGYVAVFEDVLDNLRAAAMAP